MDQSEPQDPTPAPGFNAPAPADLDAVLPGFSVTGLIAQGGMGAIYRAVQTKLDRPVALKILPSHAGQELDFVARFEAEAKAMARLSHPNIVGVYDYGETPDGSLLYISMELVEGDNLETILASHERLAPETFIPLVLQICSALDYAHTNNIHHLDIKPGNILVTTDNQVKVADFGLAKVHHPLGTAHDENPALPMGTPDYAAPELFVTGATIDHRADVYAVGVLIYETLTGDVPRGEFVRPSEAVPGTDRRFDHLVLNAMAHDLDDRYFAISDLAEDLGSILAGPRIRTSVNTPGVASAPPRSRRNPVVSTNRRLRRLRAKDKSQTSILFWTVVVLGIIAILLLFFNNVG